MNATARLSSSTQQLDSAAPLVCGVVLRAACAAVVNVERVGQCAILEVDVVEQAVRTLEQTRGRRRALVVPSAVGFVSVRIISKPHAVVF